MKFSLYDNVKSQKGIWCTLEQWLKYSASKRVKQICESISQLSPEDHDAISELKKGLPVVTWQAYFEGRRLNSEAQLSGLCMLDVDHVDDPYKLWNSIVGRREELGILLAHKTPSGHGLRLVFLCRPEFSTLDECQQWMAREIGVEHDAACKDPARASYMVPESYVYYYDGKLFSMEPEVVYDIVKSEPSTSSGTEVKSSIFPIATPIESASTKPMTATLQTTYRGLPLKEIAHQWLLMNGGEPVEGQRNDRIHTLAYVMRCITDYNEEVLMAALPRYGLDESEVRRFVHSACVATPTNGMPKSLQLVLQRMLVEQKKPTDDDRYSIFSTLQPDDTLPPLPPLIRELVKSAPEDFKRAVVLCQLPLLGTLGSKLRAVYLDGKVHSPSFQVSLEAPQASGKSFMTDLSNQLLAPIDARDERVMEMEENYAEKVSVIKNTDKKGSIGPRPKGILRHVTATISNTMLLQRLKNSQELHLICVAPEIDTVHKANKKSFSDYSDLLRKAFDNDKHGQDYYSTDTVSGKAKVFFNTLFSGTPKQMRRFYPDVENGLVSRVLFVTFPDQFGKRMPVWKNLSAKDMAEVEQQRDRLDAVSVVGDTVQPEHLLELGFLNMAMDKWLEKNRQEAIRTQDRTRDTFYRRAAVVGFRAGMLAYFLYGEKDTRTVRKNTVAFAQWVADQMLTQHMLRFEIDGKGSNTNKWEEAYGMLGNEFTIEELEQALMTTGSSTPLKNVLYKWHLSGCIEDIETAVAANGRLRPIRFRKK